MKDLRNEIAAIEADIDAGRYRPGPWDALLRRARTLPRTERRALADDVSRISRKLHRRRGLRSIPVGAGVAMELLATLAGGVLLAIGRAVGSNVFAILAASIWITTFQPLIKLATGSVLGIRYDYAYLSVVEPRFKMQYGTYLAAPRWARIVLQLSGTVGSPLGAWAVGTWAGSALRLTRGICGFALWATVVLNALLFVTALLGVRRLGTLRLATTSGGLAAVELRQAAGLDGG